MVSGEDKPKPKDWWDVADIVAKALGGLFIPLVLAIGIKVYETRQRAAEEKRERDRLVLQRIDTLQKFLPQLLSSEEHVRWASLALISAAADADLALQVGKWYVAQLQERQDRTALQRLVNYDDPRIAELAKKAYDAVFAPPASIAPAPQVMPAPPDYRLQVTTVIELEAGIRFADPSEGHGPFVTTRGDHVLWLPQAFRVGIYLVTNEFFREFVRGGGYATESFWLGTPARARQRFLSRDEKSHGPATWLSADIFADGTARHPVAGISYYEAVAFCRWLQARFPDPDKEWTWGVPTEDMWELEARTTQGFVYPWGPEFRSDHCNSAEAGVGTTTEVGRFGNGRSSNGCHDLAGNLWEFVEATDTEPWSCVLRGGSYRNSQYEVRSHLRLFSVPRDHRPPDFGFRCVQTRLQ